MLDSRVATTLVAGLAALGSSIAAGPATQGAPTVRTVLVSATNAQGTAVTDLGPADVTVEENGTPRPVLDLAPVRERLQVALLVDNNGVGLTDIRRAMAGFLQRVYRVSDVSIVATAGQNVTLVDFTSDPAKMQQGITHMQARPGPSAGHLLEGIDEAAKALGQREGRRKAIVVVSFGGEEFSDIPAESVLDRLRTTGVVLDSIVVGKPEIRAMNPLRSIDAPQGPPVLPNFNRNQVLEAGPRQSGGRHEQLIEATGLPDVMASIADELVHQYQLTYELPPGVKPSERLAVTVKRPGVLLHSPTRIPTP
jgi:VWFA-related protein